MPTNSISLTALFARRPDAAQVGYAINHPQWGGVDLDQDPNQLTWDEFVLGAPRILSAYPSPLNALAVETLRSEFLGQGPVGATSLVPYPDMQWPGGRAAAVALGPTPRTLGPRSVAHGGCVLTALPQASGTTWVALPFPTERRGQGRDLSKLKLVLVGPDGRPSTALRSVRLEERDEKTLLLVELAPAELAKSTYLRWSVPVDRSAPSLLDISRPSPFPPASLPPETLAWLNAAPMIQVNAPELQALAANVRRGATSVQQVVTRTLAAIARLRLSSFDTDYQNDALSFALTGKGDCTAHANLFAALMRANGIPTRVVTGIQRGDGQNMHYRNEYFLPGTGWVHVEPQGTRPQWDARDWVETGLVSPKLEQAGRGFMHYLGVHQLTMLPQEVDAAGAPRGSGSKLTIASGLVIRDRDFRGPIIHAAS